MSQENVELARSGYAAPDPWTALADRIAADVELDFTAVYPERPIVHGMSARQEFPYGRAMGNDRLRA